MKSKNEGTRDNIEKKGKTFLVELLTVKNGQEPAFFVTGLKIWI